MNAILPLGRWMFALGFALLGLNHFLSPNAYTGMVPDFLPAREIFVFVSGGAMIAASVAMLLGKYDKLAATLLGIMLLAFIALVWLPGLGTSEGAITGALKDLCLAGAAFMFAGHYASDRSVIG